MIKGILFLFITLSTIAVNGASRDSTNGKWNLQLRGDYGFIIAHRPALVPLQQEHVKGFEITLARTSSGQKEWQNTFNFPDYGITCAFFDLGSERYLGKGIAVYPFIDFPLGRSPEHGFHFRYGMGLGYVEKTFDARDNIKNSAIGSHVNGLIHFDLHYEKRISKRSSIEIGTGITHYSNGSFELPNLGINIATINLAIHHSFGENTALQHQPASIINKKPQLHIYTGGFIKKVYPPNGKSFVAGTISAMRLKPFNNKSAWGIGTDLFYDNSLSERIERRGDVKAKSLDDFRPGIYGAYHLTVNKIGLMFNMGYYIYTKWKEDGNIYHRICIRYYFEKIFLCLNLKTHYARADFIELGIGYRFIK